MFSTSVLGYSIWNDRLQRNPVQLLSINLSNRSQPILQESSVLTVSFSVEGYVKYTAGLVTEVLYLLFYPI